MMNKKEYLNTMIFQYQISTGYITQFGFFPNLMYRVCL